MQNEKQGKVEKELPPAMFIAGALALDFLNSIATPVDEVVEWIGNGADFLSWMNQAGLMGSGEIRTIKRNLTARQLDYVAKEAGALRDWFRLFVHKNMGRRIKKTVFAQLRPLNRLLGSDAVFWKIEPAGNKRSLTTVFRLRPQRHWRKPASLLAPLAEEIAKFIASADFKHIKACEGEKCTLLFLDQSNQLARRWCSMAVCGNRAKVAAFAARSTSARNKGM